MLDAAAKGASTAIMLVISLVGFLIDCCIGLFDTLGCLAAKGASTAIMLVYQLQMIAPSN